MSVFKPSRVRPLLSSEDENSPLQQCGCRYCALETGLERTELGVHISIEVRFWVPILFLFLKIVFSELVTICLLYAKSFTPRLFATLSPGRTFEFKVLERFSPQKNLKASVANFCQNLFRTNA